MVTHLVTHFKYSIVFWGERRFGNLQRPIRWKPLWDKAFKGDRQKKTHMREHVGFCIWRPVGESNPCCRRERAES
jgi:hypothetical protein